MALLDFFDWLNESVLVVPATCIFLMAAVFLTIYSGFAQIRLFPRFLQLVKEGVANRSHQTTSDSNAIDKFHALFTAMATTIGTGNVVGPTIAIYTGGPGALFWLVLYIFFGAVTKFYVVAFAVATRIKTDDNKLIGGPMVYLRFVHPWLANWYVVVMTALFIGFSTIQSNTLAEIFAQESVPHWMVGLGLALTVCLVLYGGVERIGWVASRLVPLMFVLYVAFVLLILLQDRTLLWRAFELIALYAFQPAAVTGGFLGATVFQGMRAGIYKGVFISEAGLGTSSIAHAMADIKAPIDQGTLAMFSMLADALLSMLSGLLVLVTGVWLNGVFRSTFIYEAFKLHAPAAGQWILLLSITLFVVTTVIGNSFNGVQSFASMTHYKGVNWYICVAVIAIFFGALVQPKLAWAVMDTLMTCVAIPHLVGSTFLVVSKSYLLKKRVTS